MKGKDRFFFLILSCILTGFIFQDLVTERTRQLFEEKQKTEDLLHRMLPLTVARKLTHGIAVEPGEYFFIPSKL